jgi:4a-hydroxytetrahydrobiopterin dehydratase
MAEELYKKKCVPCEGGVPPLTPEQAGELLKQLSPEWMLVDGGRLLARGFTFKDFKKTIAFVNKVADVAEAEGHHPDMNVGYGTLGIELTTHAIGGLSENDFILASKVDQIKL